MSKSKGYVELISDLKSLKNSLAHNKENKYNRELILKTSQAINILANQQKTNEDHENYTTEITEENTYRVYQTSTKDFAGNAQNTDALIKSSSANARYLYQSSKV